MRADLGLCRCRIHMFTAPGQMEKEGTRTVTSLASGSGDQVDGGWDAGGEVPWEELGVEPRRTLCVLTAPGHSVSIPISLAQLPAAHAPPPALQNPGRMQLNLHLGPTFV